MLNYDQFKPRFGGVFLFRIQLISLMLKCNQMGIFSKRKKNANSGNGNGSAKAINDIILNVIRDAIVIVDSRGVIQYMNPAAFDLFDSPREEAIGLHYTTSIRLVDQNGALVENGHDPIASSLRENKPLETREFSVSKIKLKESVPVSLTITPTSTDPNSSRVIILRNIAKELKEEQERSEFISTASHEMRHPVASIEGYLGLALSPQTAAIDARARAYLEKAHESSQHLGRLFRDLLDASRFDDNRVVKIHNVPVEMTVTVKQLADSLAPAIAAKGLTYNFGQQEVEKNILPSSARKLGQVIYSNLDIDFLREIIDNLINNAIKYTPSGGSIVVSVIGNDNEAIISVADTGIGISREHQKHIFQKFYRVDNSEIRSTEGTGLGLYIVKQRVGALHGRVWVESNEGRGSTFFVAFPRISSKEYEQQKMIMNSIMAPSINKTIQPTPAPISQPAPAETPSSSAPVSQTPAEVASIKPVVYMSAEDLERRKAEFSKNMQTGGTQNV